MTGTVLIILLALAAWCVLSVAVALVVGRRLRTASARLALPVVRYPRLGDIRETRAARDVRDRRRPAA